MRRLPIALTLLLTAGAPMIAGQTSPAARSAPAKFDLTVDSIMRGPELVGFAPTGVRWSGDSQRVYFEWRRPGEDEASTYVLPREGGEPRRLSDDERKLAPPPGGVWDRARRRVLFVDDGDVVLVDSVTGMRRQITRTADREENPRWARNESHVTFVREGSLYVVPIDPGAGDLVTQLVETGAKKPDPRLTDSQKYVKAEEEKLIEFVREQAARRKRAEKKQEAASLPKIELPEGQTAADLMLSSDGTHVFAIVTERPRAAKAAIVPSYVTESAYTEDIQTRTFVGDAQTRATLAILNLKTRKTVWADGGFAGERKPRPAPPAGPAPEPTAGKPGPVLREIGWSMPTVSTDGRYTVGYARSLDNKDRWIVLLDPETGGSRLLDWLHDGAWIREVRGGFGGFGGGGVAEFLPDDRRIWFVSEKDGWAHLYTIDVTATEPRATQLTSGRWEITSAELAPDRQHFSFVSTEEHPGERHLYSLGLDGGARTKVTAQTGGHNPEVSPDGALVADVYSYSNKPPELYLMKNQPGAPMTQITTTPIEAWRSFAWADPKVITFKARDGVPVYARLFTPEMLGAKRDPARPGVIFVHGAGYAQNAHRYWASYFREYMFHNLLAARGYVVLDVDYRASSGYGRDWRTAIYRHMGGNDLDDIVDGAKYLAAAEKVDPARIGLYGGSYGGFITLMAMFTAPETFAAGAALRPVTDWAHYSHGYTSAILNQPQDDPEAYERSSPIYFAQNLRGALLICHGIVDTNVHFQDSVRLAQRLIELRKENWELAVYPVENHGFTEDTSWADEYKRILKLFETNLRLRR
jgi:dipeptidyl aminopeptidase/acylaminoacyl peptidase